MLSWDLEAQGHGERVEIAMQAPAPPWNLQTSWGRFWPSIERYPPSPGLLNTVGWEAPGPRSRPQLLWGGRKVGPREAWRGRNPQAGSWCGAGGGVGNQERDGVPCRTSDIGGRAAGHRVFGYQILAGTRPGSQGPGQGQKPLAAGGTSSGAGTRPQSRCRVPSELLALHPAQPRAGPRGKGGATSPIWPPS